jgi:hypothetical protein
MVIIVFYIKDKIFSNKEKDLKLENLLQLLLIFKNVKLYGQLMDKLDILIEMIILKIKILNGYLV